MDTSTCICKLANIWYSVVSKKINLSQHTLPLQRKKRLPWIYWLQLTLTASFDWLDCDPHGCVLCQFKIILMTEKLFCLFINVKHPFTSCMCPFLEKTKISKLNESWSIFVCYRRMVDGRWASHCYVIIWLKSSKIFNYYALKNMLKTKKSTICC